MTWRDKFGHLGLMFAIALWRLDYSVVVALTIEAAQAEAYRGEHGSLAGYWWLDTIVDLVFDAAGIALAAFLKSDILRFAIIGGSL